MGGANKWHDKLSTLQWRHNEHDDVSNHQPHDSLLNYLFNRRTNKTSKLRVTGPCEGNSPVNGEFPTQRASNALLVFVREILRWPVNSPHKGPETRKIFPFYDVILVDVARTGPNMVMDGGGHLVEPAIDFFLQTTIGENNQTDLVHFASLLYCIILLRGRHR